ncbi:hypothetical protein R1flu_020787 [Riccia fluitans]|uniref:Transposase n=1 Tax=Riccia fluitans TaxID=41844 RepID=A0ABD1ZQY2_9MARC
MYRQYKHANQESQGAIEQWHDRVEANFWCTAELKLQGCLRNLIVGRLVLSAIQKAQLIPNSHVMSVADKDGKKSAWVTCQTHPMRFHEVIGWDTNHHSHHALVDTPSKGTYVNTSSTKNYGLQGRR